MLSVSLPVYRDWLEAALQLQFLSFLPVQSDTVHAAAKSKAVSSQKSYTVVWRNFVLFIKRVYAGRAAIFSENTASALRDAVVSLYEAFIHENHLKESDIISIHFSVTADLNAANPATLLRSVGYAASTALFCSAEPDIIDSPKGLIRILFYYYGRKKAVPVYRGGAERLRPDIYGNQEDVKK